MHVDSRSTSSSQKVSSPAMPRTCSFGSLQVPVAPRWDRPERPEWDRAHAGAAACPADGIRACVLPTGQRAARRGWCSAAVVLRGLQASPRRPAGPAGRGSGSASAASWRVWKVATRECAAVPHLTWKVPDGSWQLRIASPRSGRFTHPRKREESPIPTFSTSEWQAKGPWSQSRVHCPRTTSLGSKDITAEAATAVLRISAPSAAYQRSLHQGILGRVGPVRHPSSAPTRG